MLGRKGYEKMTTETDWQSWKTKIVSYNMAIKPNNANNSRLKKTEGKNK